MWYVICKKKVEMGEKSAVSTLIQNFDLDLKIQILLFVHDLESSE